MENSATPVASLSEIQSAGDNHAAKEDKEKADQICKWIKELADDEKRENALLQIRSTAIFLIYVK